MQSSGRKPGAAPQRAPQQASKAAAKPQQNHDDIRQAERFREACAAMMDEIRHVIVGQEQVIEDVLIALFSRGHCLLEGVPGLAKTLLISTLSDVLSLNFNRIQFTPDLMPADITGTEILRENRDTGERSFEFMKGPLFANIVLADEINRTPPKTQAALLEAMQEHHVTAGGQVHVLEEPFMVLATQNPIEQEGTYPLPEAQQDRFMFHVRVMYPKYDEEIEIVRRTTTLRKVKVKQVLSGADIIQLQDLVYRIPVPDHVYKYAVELVRRTRRDEKEAPEFVRDLVAWGAGPRACQYLILGAKARSILKGRGYASVQDIKAVALPVLRHRILLNFNAEAEGMITDDVIQRLISEMPVIAE
jgi:MoxR-like ATPase